MNEPIELLIQSEEGKNFLLAPTVGIFTCALEPGQLLVPGQSAGSLTTLGVARTVVVPAGCSGRIASERFERVYQPVGFGTRIYELEPISEGQSFETELASEAESSNLVLCSSHAGRFWHRPSPADDAFANEGDVVEDGSVIGLIEVMKTFTHVHYRATGGLPPRAKLLRFLAGDGAEIKNNAALIEVEPA